MNEDTKLLDWLEKQGNGDYWVARQSTMGRGYRLHNVSGMAYKGQPTARGAIITAMMEEKLEALRRK